MADKGYDSEEFIEAIAWSGVIAVVTVKHHMSMTEICIKSEMWLSVSSRN